jgi:PAS domain S-box-containing protein
MDVGELRLVAETTADIAAADDLDAALRALLHGTRTLTNAELACVRLLATPGVFLGDVRLYSCQDTEPATWTEAQNAAGSLTVTVLETSHGLYTSTIQPLAALGGPQTQLTVAYPGMASGLIVPLRAGGQLIGTLHAIARSADAFSTTMLVPLQVLADHAGGAVARARLVTAERVTREWLTAALRASNTLVFSYGLDGRIDRVDGDVAGFIGHPREAVLGQLVLDLVHSSNRDVVAAKVAARLAGERSPIVYETVLLHASGEGIPVLLATGPRLEDGRVVGGAGAATNLSVLRRLEAERDAALAVQARAEGAIATGRSVAHELGSPLTTMLNLAALLADTPGLSQDVCQDLRLIESEAVRAGALLQRFGAITRYEEMHTPTGPQLDVRRASQTATPT